MAQNTESAAYRPAQPNRRRRPIWTIMVYLAGDNNLSANSVDIMRDLEDAFPDLHHPNREIRVVACFDSNTPRPRGARYVEINHRRHQGSHPIPDWGLHNDTVPSGDGGDHSPSSPDFCCPDSDTQVSTEPVASEGLTRFLDFVLKYHEADGYMLVLYGHGSAVAGNTFLVDNNPPSFLRLEELARVLSDHFSVKGDIGENGKPKPALDILACDNCMMNGIESSFQIRNSVNFVIGSQGLMLAVGWPFRKIIRRIINLQHKTARNVAEVVCEVCARGLLDFALMDRSSDQSLLDLRTFRCEDNIVAAVRRLSCTLQAALAYDDETGELYFPAVRDAVKLARLEAQSYFDEAFVDLYDFCLLLLKQCNDAIQQPIEMFRQIIDRGGELFAPAATGPGAVSALTFDRILTKQFLLLSDVMKQFEKIAWDCRRVLHQIKFIDAGGNLRGNFVLTSYYIGPDLQYSNGVSIYFPWTLPNTPIIFDPVDDDWARARASGEGDERGALLTVRGSGEHPPKNFRLKTSFDEYKSYAFAKEDGGDWTRFLEAFFRATLRNVRRSDFQYKDDTRAKNGFIKVTEKIGKNFRDVEDLVAREVDLHKTSTDTDSETDCLCFTIKNYPRRFYISPADCLERCEIPGQGQPCGDRGHRDREKTHGENGYEELPCVSYLGWNLRGLVAVQVGLPEQRRFSLARFDAVHAPSAAAPGSRSEVGPGSEPSGNQSSASETNVTKEK